MSGMVSVRSADFSDGVQWSVTSQREIVIPADSIKDMSDEEIGRRVRMVMPIVELTFLERMADYYEAMISANGRIIPEYRDEGIKCLAPHEGKSEYIDFVLNRLRTTEYKPAAHHKKPRTPKKGYIYLVQSEKGFYKIGKTRNIDDRMHTFGVKLPFEIELIHTICSDDYETLEKTLHERYADKRVNGEWFALAPEDVETIKSIHSI